MTITNKIQVLEDQIKSKARFKLKEDINTAFDSLHTMIEKSRIAQVSIGNTSMTIDDVVNVLKNHISDCLDRDYVTQEIDSFISKTDSSSQSLSYKKGLKK